MAKLREAELVVREMKRREKEKRGGRRREI
jgi:hypothetical protein